VQVKSLLNQFSTKELAAALHRKYNDLPAGWYALLYIHHCVHCSKLRPVWNAVSSLVSFIEGRWTAASTTTPMQQLHSQQRSFLQRSHSWPHNHSWRRNH
jgi:hypothetical protein